MITRSEIRECRNTAQTFLLDEDEAMGSDDILSNIVNFKEMPVAFIQCIIGQGVDAPDDDDYSFRLFVSNIKDPDSFVPYGAARFVETGCNGIGWNLRVFGFLYLRVLYKKGSVSKGKMKIIARAKKNG